MANRFDTYVRTTYVPEPIDYYQLGVQGQEAEMGGKLQQMGNDLDTANNIMAAYTPDIQTKTQIIDSIRSQLEDVTRQNLTTPEAMVKFNKIINNRENIDKLAAVQSNAMEYQRLMKEMQDYEKETGNSINNTRLRAAMEDYNRGTEFKSGFMRGQSPGKYIDVVKDVQDVLKNVKGNVKNIIDIDGRWIVETEKESLELEDLMKRAGIQINDPKYKRQLEDFMFHNAYTAGGGDVNRGYKQYYDDVVGTLNDQIEEVENARRFLNPKDKKQQKTLEELNGQLSALHNRRDQLLNTDNYRGLYAGNFLGDLATRAAVPFVYEKTKQSVKANPYGLAETNHRYALQRQREKTKELKNMFAPPSELNFPMVSGAATGYNNLLSTQFGKDFGDLETDRHGVPVIKQFNQGTNRATAAAGVSVRGMGLTDAQNVDHTDKWFRFANYARSHGKTVDLEKIKKQDPEELRRLGVIYKQMKQGMAQDLTIGYGLQLGGNGISKEAVGNYILNQINANGGMVQDASGTNIPFASLLPKDSNGAPKQIDSKDIQATMLPGSNRVAFMIPGGGTFYVNPDKDTQEHLSNLTNLFNSTDKIGIGKVQLNNGQEVPVVSYNGFDRGYNVNRSLFVPTTPPIDDKQLTESLRAQFKNNALGLQGSQMETDELYIFYKDAKNGVRRLRYSTFLQDPDVWRGKMTEKPTLILKKQDASGKPFFLNVTEADTNVADLIKTHTSSLFEPGRVLHSLIDKNNPVFDRNLQTWFLQQSMDDDGDGVIPKEPVE